MAMKKRSAFVGWQRSYFPGARIFLCHRV